MHFIYRIQILTLGLALVAISACSPQKGSQGPQGPSGGAPEDTGSSSGGGGFVDENSTRILEMAAKGLASMIRFSSPGIYSQLPKGMTQEKLADIIQNIRYEPRSERSREGRSLMFDYGYDRGPYIVALKPFFVAYSSVPIKFIKGEALMNLMLDLRLKLAHEAAHHLGIGVRVNNDQDADAFGLSLQATLASDMVHCEASDIAEWPVPARAQVAPQSKRWNWLWNRPSGAGLFLSADNWACCEGGADAYAAEIAALYNGRLAERHKEKIQTGIRETGRQLDREYARHVYDADLSLTKNGELVFKAQIPEVADAVLELVTIPRQSLANKFSGEFSYVLPADNSPKKFTLECEGHFRPLELPTNL
ncbi:MAG: hypothetical protein ACXWQE_12265 [Bdellovibrionales bacterium]